MSEPHHYFIIIATAAGKMLLLVLASLLLLSISTIVILLLRRRRSAGPPDPGNDQIPSSPSAPNRVIATTSSGEGTIGTTGTTAVNSLVSVPALPLESVDDFHESDDDVSRGEDVLLLDSSPLDDYEGVRNRKVPARDSSSPEPDRPMPEHRETQLIAEYSLDEQSLVAEGDGTEAQKSDDSEQTEEPSSFPSTVSTLSREEPSPISPDPGPEESTEDEGESHVQSELSPYFLDLGDLSTRCCFRTGGDYSTIDSFPSVIATRHVLNLNKYETRSLRLTAIGDESQRGRMEKKIHIWRDEESWEDADAENDYIGRFLSYVWEKKFDEVPSFNHSIILTVSPTMTFERKEKLLEQLFQSFDVPSVAIVNEAVAALFGSGRHSGLVVNAGAYQTHTVPIWEGYANHHQIHLSAGGEDVTSRFIQLVNQNNIGFRLNWPSALIERDAMRKCKEKLCFVSLDSSREAVRNSNLETEYTLPDGYQVLALGAERFLAPEILFQEGESTGSVQRNVVRSIEGSDVDMRNTLLENVVLAGGTVQLPNYSERLENELNGLGGGTRLYDVHSHDEPELLALRGARVMSVLPLLQSVCIHKDEYEVYGANIVKRKFI